MAKIKIQQVRSVIGCPQVQKDTMVALGFEFLPVLEVNGKFLEYGDAVKWIKETRNEG